MAHRARFFSPSPWDYDDRFKPVAGKEKSYSTQWLTSLRVKARHKTQSRTLRRKRNRVHPRGVCGRLFSVGFSLLCRRIANCTKFATINKL